MGFSTIPLIVWLFICISVVGFCVSFALVYRKYAALKPCLFTWQSHEAKQEGRDDVSVVSRFNFFGLKEEHVGVRPGTLSGVKLAWFERLLGNLRELPAKLRAFSVALLPSSLYSLFNKNLSLAIVRTRQCLITLNDALLWLCRQISAWSQRTKEWVLGRGTNADTLPSLSKGATLPTTRSDTSATPMLDHIASSILTTAPSPGLLPVPQALTPVSKWSTQHSIQANVDQASPLWLCPVVGPVTPPVLAHQVAAAFVPKRPRSPVEGKKTNGTTTVLSNIPANEDRKRSALEDSNKRLSDLLAKVSQKTAGFKVVRSYSAVMPRTHTTPAKDERKDTIRADSNNRWSELVTRVTQRKTARLSAPPSTRPAAHCERSTDNTVGASVIAMILPDYLFKSEPKVEFVNAPLEQSDIYVIGSDSESEDEYEDTVLDVEVGSETLLVDSSDDILVLGKENDEKRVRRQMTIFVDVPVEVPIVRASLFKDVKRRSIF